MLLRAIAIGLTLSLMGCPASRPEAFTSQAAATPIPTIREMVQAPEQAQERAAGDGQRPAYGDRSPSATIISVGDGDTIRVRGADGEATTVRLSCIDAPESSQEGGQEATQRLKKFLPVGSGITLRPIERDRYGRLVAEVYRNGRSINLAMVGLLFIAKSLKFSTVGSLSLWTYT